MPFGEYENFNDCVRKNKDKDDPQAYCAQLHFNMMGKWPSEATFHAKAEASKRLAEILDDKIKSYKLISKKFTGNRIDLEIAIFIDVNGYEKERRIKAYYDIKDGELKNTYGNEDYFTKDKLNEIAKDVLKDIYPASKQAFKEVNKIASTVGVEVSNPVNDLIILENKYKNIAKIERLGNYIFLTHISQTTAESIAKELAQQYSGKIMVFDFDVEEHTGSKHATQNNNEQVRRVAAFDIKSFVNTMKNAGKTFDEIVEAVITKINIKDIQAVKKIVNDALSGKFSGIKIIG
jgi:hypothetical protein